MDLMSHVRKILVAIVDDHPVFRQGLKASLAPYTEIEVVMQAENGARFLEQYEVVKPDVCLMDVSMPELNGIDTTRRLMNDYPEARVIALSTHDQESYVANMFFAGARGYLLKDAEPSRIVEAIKEVYHGGYSLREDRVSVAVVKRLHENKHPAVEVKVNHTAELGKQERDVLVLICQEKTTAEIAIDMNLSVKTVENYRNRLLAKTGARNSVGLVMYAIRAGHIIV